MYTDPLSRPSGNIYERILLDNFCSRNVERSRENTNLIVIIGRFIVAYRRSKNTLPKIAGQLGCV